MGCYINPVKMHKEDWLLVHATQLTAAPAWHEVPSGQLPVCLVFNPGFTAAGVAFNEQELIEFSDPGDPRPMIWYTAAIEKLRTVSDLDKYLEVVS